MCYYITSDDVDWIKMLMSGLAFCAYVKAFVFKKERGRMWISRSEGDVKSP